MVFASFVPYTKMTLLRIKKIASFLFFLFGMDIVFSMLHNQNIKLVITMMFKILKQHEKP